MIPHSKDIYQKYIFELLHYFQSVIIMMITIWSYFIA